jgi:hypothetical protein
MADTPWSEAKEELFRKLWKDETLSCAMIGARLGLSKSAITGKGNRMANAGLIVPRGSPIKHGSPRRTGSQTMVAIKHHMTGATLTVGLEDKRRSAIAGPTLGQEANSIPRVSMAPAKECCWPTTDKKPWLFCSAVTVPGKDYCVEHHRIMYPRKAA